MFHTGISTPCSLFPPSQYYTQSLLEIPAQQSLSPTPDPFIYPSPSHPPFKMMLPVNTHGRSLGTAGGHISAAPRLTRIQQAPSLRPQINRHHCRQRCPPAGSSDDFYDDTPPQYYSLPPLGSIATGSIDAEVPPGTTHTCRRVKSECCASPHHSYDGDFLANLAAIQLLSGCTTIPGRQSSARSPCHGTGCDGIACMCALEDSHLRVLSKELSKHPIRPLRVQTTLYGGADGHTSLESTDRVRMCAYCRSTPMTPSASREHFPSENFDRRLQSIVNASHRDSFARWISNKRLHTSEVSRKGQSLTADETVDTDHPRHDHFNVEEVSVKSTSRGILGTSRSLQHKDPTRRCIITSPSLDSSKIPSPCEAEEVSLCTLSKTTVTLKTIGRSRNPINAPSSRIAQTW